MPSILLWNPLLSYVKYVQVTCPECDSAIQVKFWNDGAAPSRQPRMLHTFDNIVLLVSCVYKCNQGHECFSSDARILALIPCQVELPFLLLHRTGFTTEFLEMCNSFIGTGMNFYNMESLIIERRWRVYARNLNRLNLHTSTAHPCTLNGFQSSHLSNSPSNSLLAKCFLAKFTSQESVYIRELMSIEIGNSISFDHTFKVAANIGYHREDKVWVNQYNSLFLVMNANGQVVTWQLTNGTSLDQVQTVLRDVFERSKQQQKAIEYVYVDDCCKVRNKIMTTFGSTVKVKLDLFHAVQRITRTLAKCHSLFYQCVSELRIVFRQDGDICEERKFDTPPPEVIERNLDEFLKKWKDAQDHDGKPVFKTDTPIAVENLRSHIKVGCLSRIPPGGGTTKNERFHQHMKSFFHRSTIGMCLAYALLSVIIYHHNSRIKIKHKVVFRPIEASPFIHEPSSVIQNPVGIVPKLRKGNTEDDQWEIDLSEKEIDMEMTVSVYLASCKKLIILNGLQSTVASIMLSTIGFFQPFHPGLSNAPPSINAEYDEIQKQLNVYGLFLHLSFEGGLGNCFFYSLAKGILESTSTWLAILTTKGISDENISSLPHKLRLLFVQEVSGVKVDHYRSFTTLLEPEYVLETSKFYEDGHYDSCVGNLMALAMANALQASFVIIRPYDQPLYVTPEDNISHGTLFLVYQDSGKGHYDAALHSKQNITEPTVMPSATKCSCGVNSKEDVVSCTHSPLYATRCKCYKRGFSCSPLCRCKHCNNPHGQRIKSSEPSTRQKRHRHTLQIDLPCSKKFAFDSGEEVALGVWSKFETLVLYEIVATLSYSKTTYDASIAENVYNNIHYYSTASFCVHPLPTNVVFRSKTARSIHAKLKHIFRDVV